jgi:hypothetical protein
MNLVLLLILIILFTLKKQDSIEESIFLAKNEKL